MPPTRMTVNGVDLSAFGLWVETPREWASSVRQDTVLETRGAGGLLAPDAARIAPRTWSVDATLIAQTQDDALDLWDLVKLALADPWLEVMLEPWPDRMLVCRFQGASLRSGPALGLAGFPVTLSFLAPNPYLVAPRVQSYGLVAGSETTVVLGSAPSPFLVRLIGPATAPTLLYYDVNGRVRGSLVLAGNLLTNEWWEFDSQTLRMERHTDAGATVNGAPYFSTASQLFALDPADGTPDRGPALALNSGSAVLYTRKAWR